MNHNNEIKLNDHTAMIILDMVGDDENDQAAFIARAVVSEVMLIAERNASTKYDK